MSWQTFWLEPTGRQRVALRRYHAPAEGRGWTCDGGWHQAVAWTGEEIDEVDNELGFVDPPPAPDRGDPRWPVECGRGCGYRFVEDDRWQPWGEALYRRTDTGDLRVLHTSIYPPDVPPAEPGASWDAAWMGMLYRGPDGIYLTVRCPAPGLTGRPHEGLLAIHDWPVDGPAADGGRWTRTGDPRAANVTANPSIAIGNPTAPGFYHGFLRAGVLTDHLG